MDPLAIELRALDEEGPSLGRLETIGRMYHARKDLKNAAKYLHMAIDMEEASARTTLLLASVYLQAGKRYVALSLLRKGVLRYPDSEQLYFLLGRVSGSLEKHEAAIEAFEKAVSLDPENSKIRLGLAEAWLNQGSYETAETVMEPLLDVESPATDAVLLQAKILFASGKMRQGIRQIERLYEQSPDAAHLRDALVDMLQRGAMAEADAGRISRAVKFLEQAHDLLPRSIEILMGMAMFQDQLGDVDTAIEHYRDILEIDPTRLRMYEFLGRSQRKEGYSEEAEASFRKGLEKAGELGDEQYIEVFNQLLNPFE